MAKMIDVTNKTYERREKCLAEVAALKAQADKEQAQFEAEWRKLGSLIDQDKRNRELVRQREMEERDRRTQEVCFRAPSIPFRSLVHVSMHPAIKHLMSAGLTHGMQSTKH